MIMGPDHPKWLEFRRKLAVAVGRPVIHHCNSSFRQTNLLLRGPFGLTEYEVLATLDFFENLGAWCDCEVLLNVR
jgi:hypothetical protein